MDMVKEFIALTAISSPSHGEREMADCLSRRLRTLGCSVEEDSAGAKSGGNAGNLIAQFPGTGRFSGAEPLLLAAHMDRVPNGDGIRCVIEKDRIRSDGSTVLAADDLSGVCVILELLERLAGKEHCPLEIVFTVSEEMRTLGAIHLDYSRLHAKAGCCLDSSGRLGRVVIGAPAIDHFEIEFYGKKAHAGAEPEKGINALKAAARFLARVREGRLDAESTANYGVIRGGEVTNVICDRVSVKGEARSHSDEKLAAYEAEADRTLRDAVEGSGVRAEFRRIPIHGAFRIEPDESIVTGLLSAMEANGVRGYAEIGGGGMDANTFFAHGIRTVGVATGYLKNHTREEELILEDFLRAADVMEDLVAFWSERSSAC